MDKPDPLRTDFMTKFIPRIRTALTVVPQLQVFPHYSAFMQKPAQVLAFTVTSPLITKLFILHLAGVSDSTSWAYGPLQPYELLGLLERIRKDPILQEEVPKDSMVRANPPAPPTVAAVMERPMLEFLELVRGRLLDPPGGSGSGSANYGPVYHEITIYGDYVGFTPDTLLLDWVDRDTEHLRMMEQMPGRSRRYTRAEIDSEIQARDQSLDWSGTFYFPPIRVGSQPDLGLRERLAPGPNRFELGPVVLVDKIGQVRFLATYYGFFGVESREDSKACRLLNLVSGALHISGVPSFAVRTQELGHFKIDLATNTFLHTSVPGTERSAGNKDSSLNRFKQPTAIAVNQVRNAIRLSERFDQDARLPMYIPMLLDSYGSLKSGEWDYAFYSSWMIIESSAILDWEEVVSSRRVSQKEYEGLRQAAVAEKAVKNLPKVMNKLNAKDQGVAGILRGLSLIRQIEPDEYSEYEKLRIRRNEILHPDTPATEADAESCYDAAERVVKSRASIAT